MKTFTANTMDGQRVQIGFQDACTLYQEVERYLHICDLIMGKQHSEDLCKRNIEKF